MVGTNKIIQYIHCTGFVRFSTLISLSQKEKQELVSYEFFGCYEQT